MIHRPRLPSSLRWRLASAITGIVLLCTAACVIGAVIFLRPTLTDHAKSNLGQTLNSVSDYVRDQQVDLLGSARLVAAESEVKQATRDRQRQALIVYLLPVYTDLNADVLDVLDVHGRVLVRMENTVAYGDSLSRRASVRSALAGNEVVALEPDLPRLEPAQGYAMRATVPLHIGNRIIGAVVVGRQLDSIYAERIGHALGADVNLIAGGQRTGSTLTDSHGLPVDGLPAPPSVLDRIAGGKHSIATTSEDGRTVLSGVVPLSGPNGKPAGAIEVVVPLNPLYDLITQLSFLLIALGAVVVIIGTVLALYIARRVTRRLSALESVASRVAVAAGAGESLSELQPAMSVEGDDEVASLARSTNAMMVALDDRLAANERLYEAAQSRVRELTGLAEIARLLTAVPSVTETMHILGEHVCRLVGCSAVAIWMPGGGNAPALFGGHGLPDGYERAFQTALAESTDSGDQLTLQAVFKTGASSWRSLDGGFDGLSAGHASLRALAYSRGWRSATSVPLRVQDRSIGALTCYTSDPSPLTESDMSLLRTIADQVAVAVENARLYAESRSVAALEERARLARELHDSVTQALFSMTLHARAAEMALQRAGVDESSPAGRSLHQLRDLTQGALAEMRALIFELRPNALNDEGLTGALQKHTAAITAREGLPIDVEAPVDRLSLGPETEEQLYRLAQEALHNVLKHAHATQVTIRLDPTPDGTLIMEIIDNGAGFDVDAVPPGHLGLGTMAERARQAGGSVEITSHPGEGTIVRVTVPVDVTEDEAGDRQWAAGSSA